MFKRFLALIIVICIALCTVTSVSAQSIKNTNVNEADSLIGSYFNMASEFNGNYYAVYYGIEYLDWNRIKELCESMGGHLATITSQEENDFLRSFILKSITKPCGYFIGGQKVDNKWQWVTGEEWNYTSWEKDPNQPDNSGGKQDKLRMVYAPNMSWNLGWDDIDNYQVLSQKVPYGFICEWEDEIVLEPLKGSKNHYYCAINVETTWEDAKRYCELIGGHLVTVTDITEENIVEKLGKHFHEYYLGGTDKNKENTWEWITGEEWFYTNWETDKPDNDTTFLDTYRKPDGEDYLVYRNSFDFNTKVKKWDDCINDLYKYEEYDSNIGFICEWDTPPTNKSVIVLGDVDYDGEITIIDTTEVQRYLAQYIDFDYKVTRRADTNRDSAVSIMDATAIQRYIAKQIAGF